jgi:Co/Zn/Cd efflux system component
MRMDEILRLVLPSSSKRFSHGRGEHWKDSDEMHKVLHSLPGHIKVISLELLEKPMSREEISEVLHQLRMRVVILHRITRADLDRDLTFAIEQGVLKEKDGVLYLTPGGREIAEHMLEAIPFFIEIILSSKTVSIVTICIHVLLSVLKLTFGFLSHSAGLFADGIDNMGDTISSILVWLGIKYDKEKLVSQLIVTLMLVSVGGVALTIYHKDMHPGPIEQGLYAFVISLICGLLMLILSAYQYVTGKKNSNFAIMCQAIDSRNHFLISLLVCFGITLSFLVERFQIRWAAWFYYADTAVSILIGLLILKSTIELTLEFFKQGDEPTRVSHFLRDAQERMKTKVVLKWLSEQLVKTPLTKEQLEERFVSEFCRYTPKIMILSGAGYQPKTSKDLAAYLDRLTSRGAIVWVNGQYSLPDKK